MAVDSVSQNVDEVKWKRFFGNLFFDPESEGGQRTVGFVALAAGQIFRPKIVAENVGQSVGQAQVGFQEIRIVDNRRQIVEDKISVKRRIEHLKISLLLRRPYISLCNRLTACYFIKYTQILFDKLKSINEKDNL